VLIAYAFAPRVHVCASSPVRVFGEAKTLINPKYSSQKA
jgi:hypothetical protein